MSLKYDYVMKKHNSGNIEFDNVYQNIACNMLKNSQISQIITCSSFIPKICQSSLIRYSLYIISHVAEHCCVTKLKSNNF